MIQQKSKTAQEEAHSQNIKNQVEAVLNEIKSLKNEKIEQLDSIFQSAKKLLMRSIEKAYKRFSNDLATQFDNILHNLSQIVNQLESKKNTKVFRLECMVRYAHKVAGEAKRMDINHLQEKIEKKCKDFSDSTKALQPIKEVNVQFNEQCALVFKKTYQFDNQLRNVGYVNGKLLVQGTEFYKVEGLEKQTRKQTIVLSKIIKIYNQEYILVVYDDYLRIQNSKGVRMAKIDGEFFNIVNVIQIGDILFAVCMTSIVRIDVHSGKFVVRNIYKGSVLACAQKPYCGFLVILVDNELRLYNTQCQLINCRKLTIAIRGIEVTSNNYIALWNEGSIILLKNLQIVFKKQIKNIKGVCCLNTNELLIISNNSCLISLLTLETNPIVFKEQKKSQILKCVSNTYAVHLLYDNNTVTELLVD